MIRGFFGHRGSFARARLRAAHPVDSSQNPQGYPSSSSQAPDRRVTFVPVFEVTLADRTVELIDDADAYQQEGQMTTFFANGAGRQVVDCWSTRVASFRTADIVIIRRVQRESVSARD